VIGTKNSELRDSYSPVPTLNTTTVGTSSPYYITQPSCLRTRLICCVFFLPATAQFKIHTVCKKGLSWASRQREKQFRYSDFKLSSIEKNSSCLKTFAQEYIIRGCKFLIEKKIGDWVSFLMKICSSVSKNCNFLPSFHLFNPRRRWIHGHLSHSTPWGNRLQNSFGSIPIWKRCRHDLQALRTISCVVVLKTSAKEKAEKLQFANRWPQISDIGDYECLKNPMLLVNLPKRRDFRFQILYFWKKIPTKRQAKIQEGDNCILPTPCPNATGGNHQNGPIPQNRHLCSERMTKIQRHLTAEAECATSIDS